MREFIFYLCTFRFFNNQVHIFYHWFIYPFNPSMLFNLFHIFSLSITKKLMGNNYFGRKFSHLLTIVSSNLYQLYYFYAFTLGFYFWLNIFWLLTSLFTLIESTLVDTETCPRVRYNVFCETYPNRTYRLPCQVSGRLWWGWQLDDNSC